MERPEWLKINVIVRVQFWTGIVRDVAVTDTGKLFVWVYGIKNAAYGQKNECLEFNPVHIRPATSDEILRDVDMYKKQSEKIATDYATVVKEMVATLVSNEIGAVTA